MSSRFSNFRRDDSGTTAMEYGLIASIVSIAILAVLSTIGGSLVQRYEIIATAIGGTTP